MQHGRYEYAVPGVTDNVLRIMVIFTLAFVLESIGKAVTGGAPNLALHLPLGFHPLQIITHIFTAGPNSFLGYLIHLLFEFLVLWMFGSDLERNWGGHSFLKLFLLGLIGGVLAGGLTFSFLGNLYLYGLGGGIAAILAAYAMIWPDRQALFFFVIPMKMKWMILIIFVLLFLFNFPSQFVLGIGGALMGALFVYYYARKGRRSAGRYGSGAAAGAAGAAAAGAAGLGAASQAGGFSGRLQEIFRKRRLKKKQEEINRRIDVKQEVDRLLEKISREGMDSLTRKEKKFLDNASREF